MKSFLLVANLAVLWILLMVLLLMPSADAGPSVTLESMGYLSPAVTSVGCFIGFLCLRQSAHIWRGRLLFASALCAGFYVTVLLILMVIVIFNFTAIGLIAVDLFLLLGSAANAAWIWQATGRLQNPEVTLRTSTRYQSVGN